MERDYSKLAALALTVPFHVTVVAAVSEEVAHASEYLPAQVTILTLSSSSHSRLSSPRDRASTS
jgi:hypothetical protein